MALETGTYISDLVITNPTSTDPKSEGDNHLRLIKSTLKATFPNVTGAVTATQEQLNVLASGQFAGLRNRIINGNFDVWQRGASFTTGAIYTADRWKMAGAAGQTVNRVADHPFQGANGFCAEVVHTSGAQWISQYVEALNSRDLVGKTVTVTAWVLRTSGSANQNLQLLYANTADNFSATTSIASSGGVAATVWTQLTLTTTIPAGGANGLEVRIVTGGSAATVRVASVQIEVGSVASPFEYRSYTLELSLCQRYYTRITAAAANDTLGIGHNTSTTAAVATYQFPTTLRAAPTALEQSGTAGDYSVAHAATSTACSVVPTFLAASPFASTTTFTVASGLTAGQGSRARAVNTSAYMAWSAEL